MINKIEQNTRHIRMQMLLHNDACIGFSAIECSYMTVLCDIIYHNMDV